MPLAYISVITLFQRPREEANQDRAWWGTQNFLFLYSGSRDKDTGVYQVGGTNDPLSAIEGFGQALGSAVESTANVWRGLIGAPGEKGAFFELNGEDIFCLAPSPFVTSL